jgi:hypothetical protein
MVLSPVLSWNQRPVRRARSAAPQPLRHRCDQQHQVEAMIGWLREAIEVPTPTPASARLVATID